MLPGSGAEFREGAAFSPCPGSSFLGMPVLYMLASLPVAHLGYQKHKAFLLFSSPSSGGSQLGKCAPASIRSMIHEGIPLPVRRLQQPSVKIRCPKGNPCAGLSQMEPPSCSGGSRRAGSSWQRELQLLCRVGMGAQGRKHLPAAPRSPQLLLCLSVHCSLSARAPGMLSRENPVWEGGSGKGRSSPVGPGFREAPFGCGWDLESPRCRTSAPEKVLPCPVLALGLLRAGGALGSLHRRMGMQEWGWSSPSTAPVAWKDPGGGLQYPIHGP